MINIAIKPVLFRAIAFASTLMLSLTIVGNLAKFKERRQQYFSEAAIDGNVSRMSWLRMAGVNVNAHGDYPPLLLAAREGRVNAVRYLLDQGADVNARDFAGNTALDEATYYAQVPVIKELIARGASVNALANGATALDVALNRNDSAVIDLLKHYGGLQASELK
ncbi:MAG TPA: ankyrin repeat domain-containing protein [Pyrinomonadaceae bacterium]|jgi:ankyrin repeat protein|nr:ankyrin repeat domain-containing protein [Pyrinomonadaceae bacterium]